MMMIYIYICVCICIVGRGDADGRPHLACLLPTFMIDFVRRLSSIGLGYDHWHSDLDITHGLGLESISSCLQPNPHDRHNLGLSYMGQKFVWFSLSITVAMADVGCPGCLNVIRSRLGPSARSTLEVGTRRFRSRAYDLGLLCSRCISPV